MLSQATACWCRQRRSIRNFFGQSSSGFSDHLSACILCRRKQLSNHPLHIHLYSTDSHPQRGKPIIKHIPKSARSSCGQLPVDVRNGISQNHSNPANWSAVLQFGSDILGQYNRLEKCHNLSSVIKKKIVNFSFTNNFANILNDLGESTSPKIKSASALFAADVSAKIEDGNIRIISSEDKPAENSSETFSTLSAKHPAAAIYRKPPISSGDFTALQVTESEVHYPLISCGLRGS